MTYLLRTRIICLPIIFLLFACMCTLPSQSSQQFTNEATPKMNHMNYATLALDGSINIKDPREVAEAMTVLFFSVDYQNSSAWMSKYQPLMDSDTFDNLSTVTYSAIWPTISMNKVVSHVTVIAIVFDYVFLVKVLNPADGYYKLDVYLYYVFTLILPLIIGWLKIRRLEK
jgi:hypothetical protein